VFGSLRAVLNRAQEEDEDGAQSRHFTRRSPLTRLTVVALLLTLVSDAGRRGYKLLVREFWIAAELAGIRLTRKQPVTGEAFCKARHKLKWTFLQTLLRKAAELFEDRFGLANTWQGRQIFAIDGTKLSLRRDAKLVRAFGKTRGAGRPMIAVSALFNVLSRVPWDVTFGRYASGEKTLVWDLLGSIARGSILVLDRGYPGLPLLCELASRGIDFVIRVPAKSSFGAVTEFVRGSRDHARLRLTSERHLGLDLAVRALRWREGKNVRVVLTSLSAQTASRKEVEQIYRWRWNIESSFKVLKVDGFGADTFHAMTSDGVKQEICARLLFISLSQHLLAQAAKKTGKSLTDLAPKAAHMALSHTEILLILSFDHRRARTVIRRVLRLIGCFDAEKRKHRHFPRRSYKPSLRWDPTGKTSRRGH
jgi:hypothetical protein